MSRSKRLNPRDHLKLSDFLKLEELGSGGFGYVDLVRFLDEDMARACKMPVRLALKRVFIGKSLTQNMR